ncbi:MAG: 4Fe-4S binding protein [Candidatus Hadarchaeum sp.]
MKVDQNLCVRCGGCVGVCPFDAIEATDGVVGPNQRCTDCGICARACPMGAIRVERKL